MTNEEFLATIEPHVGTRSYAHAKKLVAVADQVDAMLSLAKRIRGKAVDDGDCWEISDDVFQEVQKAFNAVKS